MRYETIKLKFEDGVSEYHVIDTRLDIVVGIFDKASEAQEFRQIRESIDKISTC